MKRSIIRECKNIAQLRFGPGHPAWSFKSVHFSFLVQDNKILSVGVNRPQGYPPQYYGYPEWGQIHAEIDAWWKARGILEDDNWEMFNVRLTKERAGGVFAYAAPCEYCFSFLKSQGCHKIYFTVDEETISKILIRTK